VTVELTIEKKLLGRKKDGEKERHVWRDSECAGVERKCGVTGAWSAPTPPPDLKWTGSQGLDNESAWLGK
jgi:hypothetical protein